MVRPGETERFPLEGTWFFIVSYEDGEFQQRDFTDAQYAKKALINLIDRYIKTKTPFKLYGVWQGHWKTDVFDLDPKLMTKRLSANLEEKAKARAKRLPVTVSVSEKVGEILGEFTLNNSTPPTAYSYYM